MSELVLLFWAFCALVGGGISSLILYVAFSDWLIASARKAGWNASTCRVPRYWIMKRAREQAWRAGYDARETWYWADYRAKYTPHIERIRRIRAKGYTVRCHGLNPAFKWPHPES